MIIIITLFLPFQIRGFNFMDFDEDFDGDNYFNEGKSKSYKHKSKTNNQREGKVF